MRQYLGINGAAGTSMVAIALVIIVLGLQVPSLLAAIFSFGQDDDMAARQMDTYIQEHAQLMETYRDRFLGRSIFDTPRPTPRSTRAPVEPRPRPVVEDEPPPRTIEPPPSVIGIFGDEVWFKPIRADESILRVRLNEEKEGLKVLAITPPSSVKVSFMGNEHDLKLFDWGFGDIFTVQAAPDATIPGEINPPEPPEPPEAKTPSEITGLPGEIKPPEATTPPGENKSPDQNPDTKPEEAGESKPDEAGEGGKSDEGNAGDDGGEKKDGQEDDGKDVPPNEPDKEPEDK